MVFCTMYMAVLIVWDVFYNGILYHVYGSVNSMVCVL